MSKPTHEAATMADTILSKRERMIWGLSLHGWEDVMRSSLAIVGVFGLIVGLATWYVVKLQRAEIEASRLELDAYKLGVESKVADAKQEGIAAGKAAGDALLRAAELEKQAAELRAKNLELEAKVAPRRLAGGDVTKVAAALSKIPPRPIGIVSRLSDVEGIDFADDIAKAFADAKWTDAVRQRDWLMNSRGVAFATLEGTSIDKPFADELLAALAAGGIEASVTTVPMTNQKSTSAGFQPNALYLLIGAKP